MRAAPVGIMAAMPEEIAHLLQGHALQGHGLQGHASQGHTSQASGKSTGRTTRIGPRDYHEVEIAGCPVVLVFSGWGKVASAGTATTLITRFGVREILFTGVAGAIAPGLRMGDLVVGSHLIQHDLDPRPLFPRHSIPLLGATSLPVEAARFARLVSACERFLRHSFTKAVPASLAREFRMETPRVHTGWIASGDQFFSSSEQAAELRTRLPEVLCVEMEGAAVAQVCFEHEVPFSIVRTISDHADEGAPQDFPRFIREVASHLSLGVVREWLADSSSRDQSR